MFDDRKEVISRWHSELPPLASPSPPTGSAPALKFIWKALKYLLIALHRPIDI